MTLREIWENKGYSPTQVAAAANISVTTLYKVNRKEQVSNRTLIDVCKALGVSRQQYDQLEADK